MREDFFLALGGGDEIGASSYLLQVDGVRILIDAGVRPNKRDPYPDFERLRALGRPDALLLTHAHADHVGGLGKLWEVMGELPTLCSHATRELAAVMVNHRPPARAESRESYGSRSPNAGNRDCLRSSMSLFWNVPMFIDRAEVAVTPIRAGHILGATAWLIETNNWRVLVTGDMSMHDQRAVHGFDMPNLPNDIDLLVIESTYLYQPTHEQTPVEEQHFLLAARVAEVVAAGGQVLIPSFALGRAQEIAALFHDFFAQKILPQFPVLLDGLTRDICTVYEKFRPELMPRRRNAARHSIFNEYIQPAARNFLPTAEALFEMPPSCIVASSGMLIPGSRSAQYAEFMLHDPQNAILFSGYLDDESAGKRLLEMQSKRGGARVESYRLSAHASTHDLRQFVREVQPRIVVFVHGNPRMLADAECVEFEAEMQHSGIRAIHARNGIQIDLS